MIAVLASSTGALLAWASTVAGLPTPPANSVIRELEAWDAPPPLPYVWSPASIDWVVPASTPKPLLSQQEFMDRWEAAGLGAVLDLLFTLEVADSPQGSAARKWLTRFRSARGINPADPRTIAGTDDLCALGVAATVVSSEAVTAGRPIVLAPL